jgi:hypothetical protein
MPGRCDLLGRPLPRRFTNISDSPVRAGLTEAIAVEVREIVSKQKDIGVDVVSDGEAGKPGFSN